MNDSPADCQNCEWTEPQRDPAPTGSIRGWCDVVGDGAYDVPLVTSTARQAPSDLVGFASSATSLPEGG